MAPERYILRTTMDTKNGRAPDQEPCVLVLDADEQWLRLVFDCLGKLRPVTIVSYDYAEIPSQGTNSHQDDVSRGARVLRVPVHKRTFGRLAALFAPIAARKIRRKVRSSCAVIATFPHHTFLTRWLAASPVYYYVSDDFAEGYGFRQETVMAWEKSLVHQSARVFCISDKLAEILSERHSYPRELITVVPNGVPAEKIPQVLPSTRPPPPLPIPITFRPLAGVIGTLGSRLRLDWLVIAVESTPWLHWAFVGPVKDVLSEDQPALQALRTNPRCCFTGSQPYDDLFKYAAAFDVAVLPFNDTGINSACSPVRLFSHLPFGQPIVSTPGCDQLAQFAPLVHEVKSAAELASALDKLNQTHFNDHLAEKRWVLSKRSTWDVRALKIHNLLPAC